MYVYMCVFVKDGTMYTCMYREYVKNGVCMCERKYMYVSVYMHCMGVKDGMCMSQR